MVFAVEMMLATTIYIDPNTTHALHIFFLVDWLLVFI